MEILIIILLLILISINILLFIKIDSIKNINKNVDYNKKIIEELKTEMNKISQQQNMQQINNNNQTDLILKQITTYSNEIAKHQVQIIEIINNKLSQINEHNHNQQDKIIEKLDNKLESIRKTNEETISSQTQQITNNQMQTLEMINNKLNQITEQNHLMQESVVLKLDQKLELIRKTNEERIQNIENSINEKLDKSLSNMIDSSFKNIGENLNALHKNLGELKQLSDGVTDLNKTLSNVKSRGNWGEMQLAAIIEEIMTPAQYERNVPVKKNSRENVEFAIKIPDKTGDDFIYLAIDSKMPTDLYKKVIDAQNKEEEITTQRELAQRIKTEAKTINEKYINPPVTCNFAIMFLPTESLYAEILRIDGLFELCQSQYKVIISGPSTITAILNSLRVGFSNMAINKKSQEVLKVLQAIKSQYGTLSDAIDDTQKALEQAINKTNKMKDRTRIIQNKMSKIEELEISEANELLGITEIEE